MPFEARKFIFTVSLCAMLAVNPVLATAPKSDNSDLGTPHQVYVESDLEGGTLPKVEGYATSGIASVSYVNRMVDAAGNAADAAEQHAAAAGAYAISAAKSADAAKGALKDKVDVDQTETNKFKAMVTNGFGTVYPGYISESMLGNRVVGYDAIKVTNPTGDSGTFSGFLFSSGSSDGSDVSLIWQDKIGGYFIDSEAITSDHIAADSITSGHIAADSITSGHIAAESITSGHMARNSINSSHITPGGASRGMVLKVRDSGDAAWGQIDTNSIENGAVKSSHIQSGAINGYHISGGTINGDHITGGSITTSHIATSGTSIGMVLKVNDSGDASWGQIGTDSIENGAVTINKTSGVVGMVPIGSATATTYGQFWIE